MEIVAELQLTAEQLKVGVIPFSLILLAPDLCHQRGGTARTSAMLVPNSIWQISFPILNPKACSLMLTLVC